ncbi:hypothetical protein CP533_1959 [Ophiocordyceps camponoti-saundersi (nom. inval.)]|nr:hypothetical protein CP533_1959 [Ophiocordyceps camponoti-saundersi (nom. inval.)]
MERTELTLDSADLIESAKRQAAFQAVRDYLLPSSRFVGIGSGTTVQYVVEAIVHKGPEFYSTMAFVPTGSQSKLLIIKSGLALCNLDERPLVNGSPVPIDVAFDGADEIDEDLNLIKGGGACLFQEKLVAISAVKFVAVAGNIRMLTAELDYRKQSSRLCTQWKTIPLEVLPLAAPLVLHRLKAIGSSNAALRSGMPGKAGECVTDNGMWIIDAQFPPLLLSGDLKSDLEGKGGDKGWEIENLAQELLSVPGIVEIGLFHGFNGEQATSLRREFQAQKPVAAYFGMPDGHVHIQHAT